MRCTRRWLGLLLALALVAPGLSHADVAANEFYDLDDVAAPIEPPPGWTQILPGGVRTGISINTTGAADTKFYTRSDIAIDADQNWSFEAVLSAPGVGALGERGARMSIKFPDASALMLPPAGIPKFRHIELRLEEDAGSTRRFSLTDGNSNGQIAFLALDWADPTPRWRIRIRREGTDIIMEAEPAHTGPHRTDPKNFPEPPPYSVSAPISSFSFPAGVVNEFGFGHFVGGNYNSEWEDIHVTAADDSTTPLPYWPVIPPAPTLSVLPGATPGTFDVDLDVDLGPGAYLANDVALLTLDSAGGPDERSVADPSNTNGGLHHEDFDGLAAGQTVTATVTVVDVSGRSRASAPAQLALPGSVPGLGPAGVLAALGLLATSALLLGQRLSSATSAHPRCPAAPGPWRVRAA